MVIWITGLSGAGKTTICTAMRAILKPRLPELVVLDGDVVRAAFGHDLGHDETDRIIQVKRLQGMSLALSQQGLCVLVAVLYTNPELLAWNRAHFPEYFEVHLKASLDFVRRRDSKGLYAGALRGEIKDVVGIDAPWYPPRNPDMTIDAEAQEDPGKIARHIIAAIPRLARL